MWPGRRSTSVTSVVFIHAALWPQYTWAENLVGVCPFRGGGAGSPSNTMSPRLRPTSVPSSILMHTAVCQYRRRPKIGGCAPFFWGGSLVFILHNVSWTEAHLHAKCHLDSSSRLGTIDTGRKLEGPIETQGCPLSNEGGHAEPPPLKKCGIFCWKQCVLIYFLSAFRVCWPDWPVACRAATAPAWRA